ncbi:uncharacterized protein LOC122249349 [Penaeus japonicus]|uniref:uncharacterized protein LOC122249349 n=1 Tax=Penaeus japonicus TaxID=27405 RepID=UPI001C70B673|nr:uncharacterized protein LOC122249349 [Penaeus japonicus]XP_042867279.1 uncharacterized protein LOC122249349 [Penaeus japonicus]
MGVGTMGVGIPPFPLRNKMPLVAYMLLLSQVIAAGVGASNCSLYRLTKVGLPLKNGTNIAYLWPGQSADYIYIKREDITMPVEVHEATRNQWHEVRIQVNFDDELRNFGILDGGWYDLSIPSMNISVNMSCFGISCQDVVIYSYEPVTWAFGCDSEPTGCPSDVVEEDCPFGKLLKPGCKKIVLTKVGLPLDGPSKVFWYPLSLNSILEFKWGTEEKWTHNYKAQNGEPDPFSRIEFDIQSRFVGTGNTTVRECSLNIPAFNFSENCSADHKPDNEMLFLSDKPSVFAIDCEEESKVLKDVFGLVYPILIPIVLSLCILSLCIAKRKKGQCQTIPVEIELE